MAAEKEASVESVQDKPIPADLEADNSEDPAVDAGSENGTLAETRPCMELPEKDLGMPPPSAITSTIVSSDPPVTLFTNFLSPEECVHLIDLCDGRWTRSMVTRGLASSLHASASVTQAKSKEEAAENQPYQVASENRTGSSVHLNFDESRTVLNVAARVAQVTGLPFENVEGLVAVRYHEGQVFKQHHDGSHRPKTVFVYLNDVEQGGETLFPHLGMKVRPKRGSAVMWSNCIYNDGNPVADQRLEHEALPPGEGCTKYGVNCFVSHTRVHNLGVKIVPVVKES